MHEVTIRALGHSQEGPGRAQWSHGPSQVLEAEEGSGVDAVSVTSAGERNVRDILLDLPTSCLSLLV